MLTQLKDVLTFNSVKVNTKSQAHKRISIHFRKSYSINFRKTATFLKVIMISMAKEKKITELLFKDYTYKFENETRRQI